MQNWLNNLERLLRQGRSAILATLVQRTGHSPDSIGTQLLISTDQIFGVLSNADRLQAVVEHSREMLQCQRRWSVRTFALRPIVGEQNGTCQFVFQLFEQSAAADWLNDAQIAVAQNTAAVLVCAEGEQPRLAKDESASDDARLQTALRELIDRAGAGAVRRLDEKLLIRLPGTALRVAVAGNGVVAAALIRNLSLLPCRIVWLTSGNPIDIDVPLAPLETNTLATLANHTHLVVVSNDHELDKRLCAAALQHPALRFIGCLGSQKKAALLKRALRNDGFSAAQAARVVTPLGLPTITGNHPSIIAASIVAQILSLNARGL